MNLFFVKFHGFLVKSSSFFASNESFQPKVLSCLHEGFVPFGKSIFLENSNSFGMCFLGHDFTTSVFHQHSFGLSRALGLFSGSTPHLRFGSTDADFSCFTSSTNDSSSGSSSSTRDSSCSHDACVLFRREERSL